MYDVYSLTERLNICNHLHMPAQSGSTKVLSDMRRGYSREAYLKLVQHVRNIIPNITMSTDMIAGFCGETDSDFDETLSLMRIVKYHKAFCFPYSLRYVRIYFLLDARSNFNYNPLVTCRFSENSRTSQT